MTILEKIVNDKKEEVKINKSLTPISKLEKSSLLNTNGKSLKNKLINSETGIIAEHKRRSPSKSTINDNFQIPPFYPSLSMFGVFPHMHLIGKSIETYGLSSLGDTINFISIPDWDFEWQGAYHFNKLVKIDPGTTVNASAYYENTSFNSHNPNQPPQEICAGFNTTDEMFVIYYLFTPYMAGDENLNLDSLTQNITSNFSCQEKNSFQNCYISPNPVIENFVIQSNWPSNTIEKIEFYDLNGKLVWISKYSSNNRSPLKKSFELSKISSIKKSSVYILRIYNNRGEVQYAKLITQ